MPVPTVITDLSTTAASNSPAGSDSVGPDLDAYLRAHAKFIADLYFSSSRVIRKTADQAVNNTTTTVADSHLVLAVAANEEWVVEYKLFYRSTPNPTGFSFEVTGPTGCTGLVDGSFVANLGNESDFNDTTINGGGALFNWATSAAALITIRAHVINGANAGSVTLKWAQGTAVAQDTTLKRGSFLRAQRVA